MCLSNPSATSRMCDERPIFKWSKTGLNSDFSFSYTGFLTYYLPIAGGRTDWLGLFPRALAQSETVSSRIQSWVTDFVSSDDRYVKQASINLIDC